MREGEHDLVVRRYAQDVIEWERRNRTMAQVVDDAVSAQTFVIKEHMDVCTVQICHAVVAAGIWARGTELNADSALRSAATWLGYLEKMIRR
jgi:hypothetical protein